MRVKVITNNPDARDYANDMGFDTEFVPGTVKEVMCQSRDLLLSGWRLAADPLMGYFLRPNPYHTVFLCESGGKELPGDDIIRVERCFLVIEEKGQKSDLEEPLLSDYRAMDLSLAQNSMNALKATPLP